MGKAQGSPISPMSSYFLFLHGAGGQGVSGGAASAHCCVWRGEMLTVFLLHKLRKKD